MRSAFRSVLTRPLTQAAPADEAPKPPSPEPSVIYSPAGTISQKKLENPAGFWNNVGENRSSLFQNKGAFE